MFVKNIRVIYFYLVSFLALFALVFGTISLVEKATNYFYPVYYSNIYSAEAKEKMIASGEFDESEMVTKEEEEKNARTTAVKEMFTSLAVILVSLPLYGYHWSVIQKERKKV